MGYDIAYDSIFNIYYSKNRSMEPELILAKMVVVILAFKQNTSFQENLIRW